MKKLKVESKSLFNFFLITSQTLVLVNFISLYTLTQYKSLRINKTIRFSEIIGPYFRPGDRPGFGYEVKDAVVGYHFFGDLTELMFYAKNIFNLNYFELQIQYPASVLLLLKFFENSELINILFFLIITSIFLLVFATNGFELIVNKYLLIFSMIFISKPFLFSIDRGNLEFFVFSIFLLGFSLRNNNKKLSTILFIFATSIKPSILLLMVFLNISSLFLVGLGFLALQTVSYLYLKINPLEGLLHYVSNLNSFSQLTPYPLDVEISNLSIWSIISNLRHSESILLTPLGTFLQGLLNNTSAVGLLSLLIYFLFIKLMKIDIYNSTIHLASYITITLLFREFTGYYSSIYLVIPMIVFFINEKPKIIEIVTVVFLFLSMQPIQIFIDKDYLIQRESLELFYRLSASSLVLITCIITISYNFFELKNYKKNKNF